MSFNPQEFSALGQAQLDKTVRLSSILLSSAQRLANLQLELVHSLLAEQAQTLKALTEVKDPKSFIELQTQMAQPSIDQALHMARNLYDAALTTQNELSGFIEEQVTENSKTIVGALDRFAKNAPAGSEIAINMFKNWVNQSNVAFENASNTAKKMSAEFAEASVQAAANTAKAASGVARKRPTQMAAAA